MPGKYDKNLRSGNIHEELGLLLVEFDTGFWFGVHEVTQAQWKAVMGHNPSRFFGADRPVEQVSWTECQKFCERLGADTDQLYCLPREDQWEYACRAGS